MISNLRITVLLPFILRVECFEQQDWPWAGEVTLDGFLASERLDHHLEFFQQRLGCEDILDLLFVQPDDLNGILTAFEQSRFLRRVKHLRHWDLVQREHYGRFSKSWHKWHESKPNVKPSSSSHSIKRQWQNATVGSYLGFLDSAQEAISESNSLSLKERRAMQSVKEAWADFVEHWWKWRSSGKSRSSATVHEMLSFFYNNEEESRIHEVTSTSPDPVFECIDKVRMALRRASIGSRVPFEPRSKFERSSYYPYNLMHNLKSNIGAPIVASSGRTFLFDYNNGLCKIFVCQEQRQQDSGINSGWLRNFVCEDGRHLKPGQYSTRILSQDESKRPILISVSCLESGNAT